MSAPPFLVTFFPNTYARFKQEDTVTKADLVRLISTEHASSKSLLRLLKLAKFGNLMAGKKNDCYRSDANMEWISGIEVDYDGEEIYFDDAVQTADDANLDYIAYTTPSHSLDKPHWRMLLPLSERRHVSARDQLVARVNGLFNGKLGPESWTKSQSFYFGYVDGGNGAPPRDFRVISGDGDCIDEAASLDAAAIQQKHKKRDDFTGEYSYVDFPALIRAFTSGGDFHPLLPPIIGTIAARGTSRGHCVELMRGLFETAMQQRPDIEGRWSEVEEVIDYVYRKEDAKQQKPTEETKTQQSPWIWGKTDWDDYPPPEQKWTVLNRIPEKQVCLLSGHGATGKSTIGLYLAVAHCLSRDWMKTLPEPGPAFFIDAEDDVGVIHRRLGSIVTHFHSCFQAVFDGGLHLLPMAGEDAVMATANRDGKIIVTPFYRSVLERAGDYKPKQIIIASAADVFAGSENDRSQVQQFIGHLKKIAIVTGGSVVLITHPSLTGLNTNSILSGSTQWHNSVRARMILKTVEGNSVDEQTDSDLRLLEFPKNQYGKADEPITLRWRDGMFLPEPEMTDYEKAAARERIDNVFKACLRRFLAEGRQVSPEPRAHNNAPNAFAETPEVKEAGVRKKDLWSSMERLLKSGEIKIGTWGPASKVRKFLKFPDGT